MASFGRTLAEKDEVIATTIDNLNSVLGNLDSHSVDLSSTVTELQRVASALAKDRRRIGGSLSSVSALLGISLGSSAGFAGPSTAL